MNIPCPIHVFCPPQGSLDFDFPLANFSSEAPDQNLCFQEFFQTIAPPLGTCFSRNDGLGTASASTCGAALITAFNNSTADAISGWNRGGCIGDPPPGTPPDQPPGLPPGLPCPPLVLCAGKPVGPSNPVPLFFNQQQACTFTCPDGLPFVWNVAAGTVSNPSLAVANAEAFSIACAMANAHFMCLSTVKNSGCVGTAYSSTITVTKGVLAATPLSFTITSGSLPPGLVTQQSVDSLSFIISGTPTTAGSFNFTVQVTDANGNFMQKAYTVGILGITNLTSLPTAMEMRAYSFQLSGTGGTAPFTFALVSGNLPGITISTSGLVSGTPNYVTSGSYPFVASITDANGNTCNQNATLTVTLAPGPDWTKLVWSNYVFNQAGANTVVGGAIKNTTFGTLHKDGGAFFPSITPVNAAGVTYTGPAVTSRIILTVGTVNGFNNMTCRVFQSGVGQIGGYSAAQTAGVFTFDFPVTGGGPSTFTIDDAGSGWADLVGVGTPGDLSFTWAIVNV